MRNPGEKPTIWVTGPDRGGSSAWWFTRLAVWLAGGRAVRRTPERVGEHTLPDALILGGGADIGDEEPGEVTGKGTGNGSTLWAPLIFAVRVLLRTKHHGGVDPARDRMERTILAKALEAGIPVLGICRGMQFLNLQLGGALHPDIKGFYTETPHLHTVIPRKTVHVLPGSRLATILGKTTLNVNALHHQAVDTLGDGLAVTAKDEAGVVQAIEKIGEDFLLGVQWHPEYLPLRQVQRALFSALVAAAKGGSPGQTAS